VKRIGSSIPARIADVARTVIFYCLFLATVVVGQNRKYPERLLGDPTYDDLIRTFELKHVHGSDYLISVHQRSSEPDQYWPSRHIGLWRLEASRWRFLRRLDHDGQAGMVQPFRFRGGTYLWGYGEARHGTTVDDEVFRLESGGKLIAIEFQLRDVDRLLRPGEHIGWTKFNFSDEDLSMDGLICTGSGGCYPGDATVENGRIHTTLTIDGNVLHVAKLERAGPKARR
jgi:hypothetical protein